MTIYNIDYFHRYLGPAERRSETELLNFLFVLHFSILVQHLKLDLDLEHIERVKKANFTLSRKYHYFQMLSICSKTNYTFSGGVQEYINEKKMQDFSLGLSLYWPQASVNVT